VLAFIATHDGLLAKDIAEQLKMPIDTLDKVLSKLVKEHRIRRRGSKKAGGYYKVGEADQ
jgi:DNA-binding MarR family transcriptional regulator